MKKNIKFSGFFGKHYLFIKFLVCVFTVIAGLLLRDNLRISSSANAQSLTQPNIVLIVTDDQNFESLSHMPYTSGRTDWIDFKNAFFNVSGCCPSRASILTGQLSHHTGVETNQDAQRFKADNTLATWLQAAGYKTSLIGKYLNGYPWAQGSAVIPPGWNNWEVLSGTSSASWYYNYTLNENGVNKSYGATDADYSTDVFAKKAKTFIQNQTGPFFLMITPVSPHEPSTVATRYLSAPLGVIPRFPNFNEADVSDKPLWVQGLTLKNGQTMDYSRGKAYRSLLAVDDMVHDIFDTLSTQGILNNTVIIFMTDNGYSFGEHRWADKGCVYEECMRTPLLIRYPGQAGRNVNELAQNIDIAPTIQKLTGAIPTLAQDGKSLLPFLLNQTPSSWRTGILLRWIGVSNFAIPGFWAIRTDQYKYVELNTGEKELYDLIADPYELENRANQPAYATIQADLAIKLQNLITPPSNQPPTAYIQSVTTTVGTPIDIVLTSSDPDGDSLTYTTTTSPANGTLSGSAPNLTYTPNAGFIGTDSFTFSVNDGALTSALATVSITVTKKVTQTNLPPEGVKDSYQSPEDTSLSVAAPGVLSNDSDPEKDPLTASLITSTTNGSLILNSDGSFTYTPNSNFAGTDSFTYKASDGTSASAETTATITVTSVNDTPQITSNPTTSATTGQLYTYQIAATDPDALDTLTYSLTTYPQSMTINTSSGLVQWTPDSSEVGTKTVTVRVTDQTGLFAEQTFSINVTLANNVVVATPLTSGAKPNSLSAQTASFTIQAGHMALLWIGQNNNTSGVPLVSDSSRTWAMVKFHSPGERGLSLWKSSVSTIRTTGAVTISYTSTNSVAWSIIDYSATGVLQNSSADQKSTGGRSLSGQVSLSPTTTTGSTVASAFLISRDSGPFTPGAGYSLTGSSVSVPSILIQAEFRPDFATLANMSWVTLSNWVGIVAEIK